MENVDLVRLYEQIARIGFPAFFVYGLLRGWWYVKPHVDDLRARMGELVEQIKHANAAGERATALAEASHLIAAESLAQARRNEDLAERTEVVLAQIEAHLTRLPAGCPLTVTRPGGEG